MRVLCVFIVSALILLSISAQAAKEKKDIKEKEAKEKEAKEKEANEKEANEKEANEKEANEKEANEKDEKEKDKKEDDKPTKVVVLNESNFDQTLADIEVALIKFFAPWCGHCKALAPKYIEAADKIDADPSLSKKSFKLAEVDCDANKKIAGRFGVSGYPTLKLFRKGLFIEDYSGDRTADGIIEYMKKQENVVLNKELTTLKDVKTVTAAKTCNRTTVVGFFANKDGVDFKYYNEVAQQLSGTGVSFYHTVTLDVLEAFGFYSSGSSIQMYRPDQKPFKVAYRGTIFKQQLKDWVMGNALPNVGAEYSPETEMMFRMQGSSIVRFLATPSDYKKDVKKGFLESLSKAHPTVKFAFSDIEKYKADVTAHCDEGVKICILAMEGPKHKKGKGRTFGSTGEFSEEMATKFVNDFMEANLKIKVKSQASGPAPTAGKVATVVGTTFTTIVADPNKDVFIKFYAPWCGHCKALAPKWEELATEMADEFDNLLIAEMDMTANQIPAEYESAYKVEGFPTIYFAPKGSKNTPIAYNGGRDVSDFKTWLKSNRSK